MRVQLVVMPDGSQSWTVLDDDGEPVPTVEAFLAHLQALDRSPTTVRTYATSLKMWLVFLSRIGVVADAATIDHVSRFVAWLRAPAENVTVLAGGMGRCCPATVNKHLAALFAFYDYRARNGVELAQVLVAWRSSNRGGYRPFLHHVTAGKPVATRPLRLRQERRLPRTLTDEQVLTLIEACEHLRDRFLLVLLAETGMRVGQALGLRHADFVSHRREVRIVPRPDNANGARAKTLDVHTLPMSAGLARLYTAYMFEEYGECESDYVFVNLFAEPCGRPLRYQAVYQLVRKLRARTGIDFTLHMLRHTRSTDLLRHGVGVEVVARLLTHRSSTTTSQTYIHLDVGDLRAELERCNAATRGRKLTPRERHDARQRAAAGAGCGAGIGRALRRRRLACRSAGSARCPRPGLGRFRRHRAGMAATGRETLGSAATFDRHAFNTIRAGAAALKRFSDFIAGCAPAAVQPQQIDRPLLERYLAWLAAQPLADSTKALSRVFLRGFLEENRRHGWAPAIPTTAVIYPDELSSRRHSLPRFIPEFVMSQLENTDNLAQLEARYQNLVVLITETGLRATDACTLGSNPLLVDSAGWPCLRFTASKMRAEHLLPLSKRAAEAIRAQQRTVTETHPDGSEWLFPSRFAPDLPVPYDTLRRAFTIWQQRIGLHDEAGRAVHVTIHQLRHSLGTRLINAGVPQHVIQRLLTHASPEMTAVYAHMHDSTIRAEFERYCLTRVDVEGRRLGFDPSAVTADAEWVKHRLARATDTLPNGYCGRPPQQECPHPNACLTCPDFQTTVEFLPIHQQQADRTRELLTVAEDSGRQRQADNHGKVLFSLDKIIASLEALRPQNDGHV